MDFGKSSDNKCSVNVGVRQVYVMSLRLFNMHINIYGLVKEMKANLEYNDVKMSLNG